MLTFNEGEPVNLPNCVVMVGGEYQETDLVPVKKWGTDVEYTRIQANFLKWGSWF
jgi:hypothetical protein